MKRKEVKILGLSYAQGGLGSYILVLSEEDGVRKLPIIIKPLDAQKIALEVENIPKTGRPLTHDLIHNIGNTFGIDIQEVYIYSCLEGIFYSKLIVSNGVEEAEIECSIGDGAVLSSIYKCPIMVHPDVMDNFGIAVNDDGSPISDEEKPKETKPKNKVSVENLEVMLQEAIRNEEYEIACQIRDKIEERNNESKD